MWPLALHRVLVAPKESSQAPCAFALRFRNFRRDSDIWVVVKIMVPFSYYLGYPKRDHNFDNYPYVDTKR